MSDHRIQPIGQVVGPSLMRELGAADDEIASAVRDAEFRSNYDRAEYALRSRLARQAITANEIAATAEAMREHHDRVLSVLESPIERLVLPWLIAVPCPRLRQRIARTAMVSEDDRPRPRDIRVVPQLPIGRHRLDLAVVVQIGGRTLLIAVECDGRAFHRVPEDAARDRYLASFGIPTIRASGSEITKAPEGVATRVADLIERWIDNELIDELRP